MAFQPTTIEALREKLAELEEQRESHQTDLEHYSKRAAEYQALCNEVSAAIEDYASLLEYAEVTDGFDKMPASDDSDSPAFAIGDWVMVSDRDRKDYGRHGTVICLTNDPDRVVVEYGSAGDAFVIHASSLTLGVPLAKTEPAPPTASDMRAIFGEPVEGRDYHVMPGAPEGGVR